MQRSVSVKIVVIANDTALTTMIVTVVVYDFPLLRIERSDDSAVVAAQIKSQCALMYCTKAS